MTSHFGGSTRQWWASLYALVSN